MVQTCTRLTSYWVSFVDPRGTDISNTGTRRALYLALVLSHLGYATQVLAPQLIEMIQCMERVQPEKGYLIYPNATLPNRNVIQIKTYTIQSLTPLATGTSLWTSCFLKAHNGLMDTHRGILPLQRRSVRASRSFHNQDITGLTALSSSQRNLTLTFQRSFFNRTCRVYLLSSIRVNCLPLTTFRDKLYEYYKDALHN